MPRTHGYSKKGERCYGTVDWHARGRTNVIGALLEFELITVSLFTGSNIDSHIFHHWVEQDLLSKLPPQAVVVMDNAAFHKKKATAKIIENAGHTLEYLPTYSPELNPIEHKWFQAKAKRRQFGCDVETLFANLL